MSSEDLDDWRNMSCILEFDLRYRDEFHDLDNDYHLAPEHDEVNKVIKLIPNVNDKEKYVLPGEIVKLYERLGLEIGKIHRGLRFVESDWLTQCIEMNTTLRTKAKNQFQKNLFQADKNTVYGNIRWTTLTSWLIFD